MRVEDILAGKYYALCRCLFYAAYYPAVLMLCREYGHDRIKGKEGK